MRVRSSDYEFQALKARAMRNIGLVIHVRLLCVLAKGINEFNCFIKALISVYACSFHVWSIYDLLCNI